MTGFRYPLAAAAALLIGAAPALASEPAATLPEHRWTGLYVGAHVGDHRIDTGGQFDNAEAAGPFWVSRVGDRGADGGVQAGYNVQWERFVLGLEADYSLGGFSKSARSVQDGDASDAGLFAYPLKGDLDYLATVRMRVGVAAPSPLGRSLLLYVTGGMGFTHFDVNIADGRSHVGFNASGPAYGGGAELALTRSLSLRAEFLRVTFDKQLTLRDVGVSGVFDANDGDAVRLNSIALARLGLNFKLTD